MTRPVACYAIQFTRRWLKGFVPFKITSDFEHFSSDLLFEGALMETSPTHHSNAQQKFNLTHHWSGEGKAEGFPRERLSMNVEFAKKGRKSLETASNGISWSWKENDGTWNSMEACTAPCTVSADKHLQLFAALERWKRKLEDFSDITSRFGCPEVKRH